MRLPDELGRVAAVQDGLVTRQQAILHGMTTAAVRHALGAGGDWQRVLAGVYATFTGPLQARHRLRGAVLYAGPGSMISGGFACRGYGLRYVAADLPMVVLTAHAVQRSCAPMARVRRVRTLPGVRHVGGLPVAVPERAVLDACRDIVGLRDVRALVCESVQVGLTTPDRIGAALRGARWRNAGLVRAALADAFAGCRSAPECELRDLVRRSRRLEEPAWNQRLRGVPGPALIPDACWDDARVVVEIDSAQWHRFGDRVELSEQRRARYAALGWTVVPISPRRLRDDPRTVLVQIESAVAHGRARGYVA